jgi:hypothetical protein
MNSPGEKWLKLLRNYAPGGSNNATEAENVVDLTKLLGMERLSFHHPARDYLDKCIIGVPPHERATIIITGTAGDGKTTLCYDIIKELTGAIPTSPEPLSTIDLPDGGKLDFIRDLTAWRKRNAQNKLVDEQVPQLEAIASHALDGSHHPTIIAVNDGQMHEVFRALPDQASPQLREFFSEAFRLHSSGTNESQKFPHFRLFNLSTITSEFLMKECIEAILKRPEWNCLQDESDNPLFAPQSSFAANYRILQKPQIQDWLADIARLADACQFHLPIRGIFLLLTNILLGHEDASEGLLDTKDASKILMKSGGQTGKAAFHRNLFGYNLTSLRRKKHNIYRFLESLQIGCETTNDIDELLIFGDRDEGTKDLHAKLVAHDPEGQRSKSLVHEIANYIRGDLSDQSKLNDFLDLLAHERRRVFVHADDPTIHEHQLWSISAFHHAGSYLREFLQPLREGKEIHSVRLSPVITGLNRIWTGAYIANTEQELFFTSGLDMTTSPVSDILLKTIEKSSVKIVAGPTKLPCLSIARDGRKFEMPLTLMRFEFIMRANEGAMPGSFSREACEDLMALKQRALRDLDIRESEESITRMNLGEGGKVQKTYIEFV